MALRTAPFHRSLTRPNLFMGCDRELVLFTGLISFTLVFTGMTAISAVYGVCLWLLCLFFLRQMAKADPLLRWVYLRHIRYAGYYPARSTPRCVNIREYK